MTTYAQYGYSVFATLAVVLITVPTTRGRPHQNDVTSGCEALGGALWRVYEEVLLPVYDKSQVISEVKMVAGINPEDLKQVTSFACSLQGSSSVKELGSHFLLPPALSKHLYAELMEELSRCGGVQGCKVYMAMMSELAGWVHDVGYPSFPLRTTQAQVTHFLRHMAAEYGPDFLSSPALLGDTPAPQRPILVNEKTVDGLATSLTKASSLEDLARLTGYPTEVLHGLDAGLRVLAQAGPYVRTSNAALQDLLDVTDRMGLLYLPEQ